MMGGFYPLWIFNLDAVFLYLDWCSGLYCLVCVPKLIW